MKFFFKDFVMSSGRFNLPLQQIKVLFFPELMAVLGFWNAFFLRVSSSFLLILHIFQPLYYKNKTEMPKFEHFLGFQ